MDFILSKIINRPQRIDILAEDEPMSDIFMDIESDLMPSNDDHDDLMLFGKVYIVSIFEHSTMSICHLRQSAKIRRNIYKNCIHVIQIVRIRMKCDLMQYVDVL